MKKVLMISTTVLVFAALGLLSRGSAALSGATQEAITGDWIVNVLPSPGLLRTLTLP